MRNMTFNPEQRRGHPSNRGSFAEYEHSDPEAELEELVADGADRKLAAASIAARQAENSIDPTELDRLADVDSDMMHAAIAENPATRTATLVRMSERSYSDRAQFAVAARADCPPELLTRIAESKFPRTRARVAGNPRTTAATLRQLAGDGARCPRSGSRQP